MYELIFLKALLKRQQYINYRSNVNTKDLEAPLRVLFTHLDDWFSTHDEGDCTLDDLYAKAVTNLEASVVKALFGRLEVLNAQEGALEALESFKQKRMLEDLSVLAYEASTGAKPFTAVLKRLEQFETQKAQEEEPFVEEGLETLLQSQFQKQGLRWRLKTLNIMLGSLRPGDFGFFVARPETGKTTMLCSEVTHFATQLLPDQGPILYFNNEEQGKKVKLKLYQSALGATLPQLLADPIKAEAKFQEVTQGKIKLYDSDIIFKSKVEAVVKKWKPSVVIFDQIDKIKGFEADREDLKLGAIYEWARGLAKKYECVIIGVCQADGTAEGVTYLNMGHASNSKTSKQAEADFIIGIGMQNDPAYQYTRYISVMKNKLYGDADTEQSMRHGRMEILIRPERGRYEDIIP